MRCRARKKRHLTPYQDVHNQTTCIQIWRPAHAFRALNTHRDGALTKNRCDGDRKHMPRFALTKRYSDILDRRGIRKNDEV